MSDFHKMWEIAHEIAELSTCTRRRIGAAVCTSTLELLGTGCNTTPDELPTCEEGGCPRGRLTEADIPSGSDTYDDPFSPGFCISTHAEVIAYRTALLNIGRMRATKELTTLSDLVMFVTAEPCTGCLKFLVTTPVTLVGWLDRNDTTHYSNPLQMLKERM